MMSTSTHERLRANSTYLSAALSQDVQYTAGTRARDLYKKQPQNSQCPFTEDADASKSLFRLPSGIIGCVRHDNQILHTYKHHEVHRRAKRSLLNWLCSYFFCILHAYRYTFEYTLLCTNVLLHS